MRRTTKQLQLILFTLACWIMSIGLGQVVCAESYSVLSLGIIAGDSGSRAEGITNGGDILCETSRDGTYGYAIWSLTTGLNTISLSDDSVILSGINDSGNAVGWRNQDTAIMRDTSGQIHDLANLTGFNCSWAHAINSADLVVGNSAHVAVLWQADGIPIALAGTLTSPAAATAISDNGLVLYTQLDIVEGTFRNNRSYIWKPDGSIQQLERISESEGISSGGRAINNLGQVVGTSSGHAILWNPDGSIATDFGIGAALDINNLGQIVGTLHGRAVMWDTDGSIIDLPSLNGWTSTSLAVSINDNGQIVGTIFDQATNTYPTAVLWQPVPEPSAFAALACGLVGIMTQTRKRRSL